MDETRGPDGNAEQPADREPVEEIAEEAAEENPDTTTRREAFELELMEEDRSNAGRDVEVDTDDDS